MESKISLGQVVYSKSGRDAGKAFLVVAYADGKVCYADGKVCYADGDLRRLENAKKKNWKHIIETEFVDQTIMGKLQNGEKVTNADIRKALSNYVCDGTEEV